MSSIISTANRKAIDACPWEQQSLLLGGTMKDELGVAIILADVATFTVTVFKLSDNAIVNSLQDVDILNANNGTLAATGGAWTLLLVGADNELLAINDSQETHVAQFRWTYGSTPVRSGAYEVEFNVLNLRLL